VTERVCVVLPLSGYGHVTERVCVVLPLSGYGHVTERVCVVLPFVVLWFGGSFRGPLGAAGEEVYLPAR
jgi:hypothetical protein